MKLVVIVSDTFRADNLKIHGGYHVSTPRLDNLAKESMVFTKCYTGSFPTVAHRHELFTGLYSAFNPEVWRLHREKDIAQYFKEAGYLTQLITDTQTMMRSSLERLGDNFERSFHGYNWIRGQEGDVDRTRFNYLNEVNLPREKFRYVGLTLGKKLAEIHAITNRDWRWEEDRFCARLAREASLWLEDNYKADRFLLWLDFFDPHEPWDPPEYLVSKYQKGYKGVPMTHPNYGSADRYEPKELENLRAHYLGEVELVDKWIGHVLRKLDDVGLSEETTVIFTSDHGHLIGEHGWTGKSNYDAWWLRSKDEGWDKRAMPLYRELAHIPLLIKAPRIGNKGICDKVVQPVDLFSTLLELAGLKIPHKAQGHSLVPLLKGLQDQWPRETAVSMGTEIHGVIQPYMRGRGSRDPIVESEVQGPVIRNGEWALYLHGERYVPELYHTSVDSAESKNVIQEEQGKAVELFDSFMEWLRKIEADPRIGDWAETRSPSEV